MGNSTSRSSKKGKEICDKLDLKNTKASSGPTRWKGKTLEHVDEEMIDQVYEVLRTAGRDGNQDVQFLRRYVKQQLKSSKKGKKVLDELGEEFSNDLVASGKAESKVKFQRSTAAVSA